LTLVQRTGKSRQAVGLQLMRHVDPALITLITNPIVPIAAAAGA
jgi:hypothetical protein